MTQDLPLRSKKIQVPAEVWEIIQKNTSHALEMLNSYYRTDGGRNLNDYYKGYLYSLTSLKDQLELAQEEEGEGTLADVVG